MNLLSNMQETILVVENAKDEAKHVSQSGNIDHEKRFVSGVRHDAPPGITTTTTTTDSRAGSDRQR